MVTYTELAENITDLFPGIILQKDTNNKIITLTDVLQFAADINFFCSKHFSGATTGNHKNFVRGNTDKFLRHSSSYPISADKPLNRKQVAVIFQKENKQVMDLLIKDFNGNVSVR